MKTILSAVLLLVVNCAQAGLVLSQTFGGGYIPDGNPAGVLFGGTFNQAGAGDHVLEASISLNISGGYNGDLYAYLSSPNGTVVVLMNQPGTTLYGAGGAGMIITLLDGASEHGSIQSAGDGILAGSYNAYGSLADFGNTGSSVNGSWGLFFADMSSGGGSVHLDSWTLNLTAVPEPIAPALLIFAMIMLLIVGVRFIRQSFKPHWPCPDFAGNGSSTSRNAETSH